MKIISVLYYPFEKKMVVRVTRAAGYFEYPQKTRTYSVRYDAPIALSFFHWFQVLSRMNEERIYSIMKNRKY